MTITIEEYMEYNFGDEWRKCLAEGKCWIIQNTHFNPADGQGLDLWCLAHDHRFNIPATTWDVSTPKVCPCGSKNKLN